MDDNSVYVITSLFLQNMLSLSVPWYPHHIATFSSSSSLLIEYGDKSEFSIVVNGCDLEYYFISHRKDTQSILKLHQKFAGV